MADTHAKHHDYHLVNPSPWPAVGATAAFITAVGLIIWMRSMGGAPGLFGLRGASVFLVGVLGLLFTVFMWWRDVIKEAHGGDHTPVVQLHLRYGMILFIASEVMFFVAWFWAYFDSSLFPSAVDAVGGMWPPKGMKVLDPFDFPLLNTLILLCSGTTVTWAHHALIHGDRRGLIKGLWCTILLGMLFTSIQAYE